MVGHTGIIPAATRAVETVDRCLGEVVEAVHETGGGADRDRRPRQRRRDAGARRQPQHRPLDQPGAADRHGRRRRSWRDGGILADVAPTALALLGIAQPRGDEAAVAAALTVARLTARASCRSRRRSGRAMPLIWSCDRRRSTTRSKSLACELSRLTITSAATTVAISRNRNSSAMKRAEPPRRRRRGAERRRRAALRAARSARGRGAGAARAPGGASRAWRPCRAAGAATACAARAAWPRSSSAVVAAESRPRSAACDRLAHLGGAAVAVARGRAPGSARPRGQRRRDLRVQLRRAARGVALLLAQRQLGQRAGLVGQLARRAAGTARRRASRRRSSASPPRRARARATGRRRCRAPSRSA